MRDKSTDARRDHRSIDRVSYPMRYETLRFRDASQPELRVVAGKANVIRPPNSSGAVRHLLWDADLSMVQSKRVRTVSRSVAMDQKRSAIARGSMPVSGGLAAVRTALAMMTSPT
jgi:hypothetical protein